MTTKVDTFAGWDGHIPPQEWQRLLAMDVGGSSPNALVWCAVCPDTQTLVAYDEVYEVTTDMRKLADLALPRMKSSKGDYNFKFKVIDYENRIAAEEMSKHGIRFDNAVKHNKMLSIHRLAGYFHPNPRRPFPAWHPSAGKPGAPLFFVTPNCKNIIREVPLQRWRETGGTMKDEPDKNVPNHTVDCLLYIVRMLPPALEVKIVNPVLSEKPKINLMSSLYWADRKKYMEQHPEKTPQPSIVVPGRERPYRPGHQRTLEEIWDNPQLKSSSSSD